MLPLVGSEEDWSTYGAQTNNTNAMIILILPIMHSAAGYWGLIYSNIVQCSLHLGRIKVCKTNTPEFVVKRNEIPSSGIL